MSDCDYQILVIEDDPSVAAGLVSGLKKEGYGVELASEKMRRPNARNTSDTPSALMYTIILTYYTTSGMLAVHYTFILSTGVPRAAAADRDVEARSETPLAFDDDALSAPGTTSRTRACTSSCSSSASRTRRPAPARAASSGSTRPRPWAGSSGTGTEAVPARS